MNLWIASLRDSVIVPPGKLESVKLIRIFYETSKMASFYIISIWNINQYIKFFQNKLTLLQTFPKIVYYHSAQQVLNIELKNAHLEMYLCTVSFFPMLLQLLIHYFFFSL